MRAMPQRVNVLCVWPRPVVGSCRERKRQKADRRRHESKYVRKLSHMDLPSSAGTAHEGSPT